MRSRVDKMRIGQQILKMRNLQEAALQRDAVKIRIGQNVDRRKIVVVRFIAESAIGEFALYCEPSARPPIGLPAATCAFMASSTGVPFHARM